MQLDYIKGNTPVSNYWTSLSQSVVSRFRSVKGHSSLRRKNGYARRNRRFERLEERTVFSASLGSALTIGNGVESVGIFDIASDSAGNSYVTGVVRGITDFDLSNVRVDGSDIVSPHGMGDAFVAKYAADDSLLWVKRMGGNDISAFRDYGRELAIDAAGSVFVVGEFGESADFGPTVLSSAGYADGFVAKLDASGNFQWAKRWGNAESESARGVDVDAVGNVYVYGARVTSDEEVMKFGPSGTQLWSKSFATHSLMSSGELAVTANGDVFIAGAFQGTVDFDPSTKTKNIASGAGHGGFLVKLNTDGKLGWVSPFLGKSGLSQNSAYAMSVEVDRSGAIYVGGGFRGTVDFDPGNNATYLSQPNGGFITKLNASGGLIWAKQLQSDANVFVYELDTDAAGFVYVAGIYYGTTDFDPGAATVSRNSAGQSDLFVLKLSSAGNLAWAESFGGTGSEVFQGLTVTTSGDILVGGHYTDPFDANPDPFETELLPGGTASRGLRLRLRQA